MRSQATAGVVPQQSRRMLVVQNAHKKGAGSTKNGRDSNSKSRGVKVLGGQPVKAGGIIVRQTGSTVRAAGQEGISYSICWILWSGEESFGPGFQCKRVGSHNPLRQKVPTTVSLYAPHP